MKMIKGALAVAMLIGAVKPMELNQEYEEMVDLKLKISNPEEAKRAHNQYEHALTDFYDALPDGGAYQKLMKAKGEDLLACYTTWHEKTKNSMQYVDPVSFTEYYDSEKAKSTKRNETIAAEKKKKEEAAAKKKKEDEEKAKKEDKKEKPKEDKKEKPEKEAEEILAEGDEKPAEKKEEEKKPKDYFFAELDNLKNAGFAFDNHVQQSLANMGAPTGELSKYWIFHPQALLEMKADDTFKNGIAGYEKMTGSDRFAGKEIKAYNAAVKALQDARTEVKEMLTNTPGLKEFFKNKQEFVKVWLRGFAKFEGCPSQEQFQDKLKVNKDNQYTPYLKKAAEWMDHCKEADRIAFNKKFKNVLKLAGEWVAAGKTMDAKLLVVQKEMKEVHTDPNVQKCMKFTTDAMDQRVAMEKVYKALMTLNGKEEKAEKEAAEYQKDVENEAKANIAVWVILVLLILATIGGVTYCKVQKKACFAEKEENAAEGGENDKSVFKKQNKKHTKESLMPAFKVTEEQA